jgi:hypothetical protein
MKRSATDQNACNLHAYRRVELPELITWASLGLMHVEPGGRSALAMQARAWTRRVCSTWLQNKLFCS